MKRWERLEAYLFDYDLLGGDFSSHEYAAKQGLVFHDASRDIQAYLVAQRSERTGTLYVLKRLPGTRTTNARWSVGVRTKDVRLIGQALHDDVRRRVMRAFAPDLHAIEHHNPAARKNAEKRVRAVIDSALPLLEIAATDGQ